MPDQQKLPDVSWCAWSTMRVLSVCVPLCSACARRWKPHGPSLTDAVPDSDCAATGGGGWRWGRVLPVQPEEGEGAEEVLLS